MADISLLERVVTVLGALGIGGYLSNRYAAKKAAEPAMAMVDVEDRRVALEEIRLILERHEAEIENLKVELESSQAALKSSRSLLRLSLKYIGLVRRDMKAAGMTPPPLPDELSSDQLPWDLNMYDN